MRTNFMLPAYAPADAGAGAAQTPEEKAAAEAAATAAAAAAGTGTKKTDAEVAAAAAAAAAGGKTAEQLAAEKKTADDAAAAAAAGAPAKYELKLPDGSLIPARALTRLEEMARKSNLTNDEAQAWLEEQAIVAKTTSDEYLAETTADKDLGGEHLAETQRRANAVIDRIYPKGDPDRERFLAFLKAGGGDNEITVVRAFDRLARLMGEDTLAGGKGGGGAEQKDAATTLYGDTKAK